MSLMADFEYPASLKATVALAAIQGKQELSDIALEYGVDVGQIRKWQQKLLADAALIFSSASDKRIEVEAQLRESEELVRTIAENSTQGLAMMNERGYCTYANPAWLKMTGYTTEEIGSKPLHYLVHHHHPDGRPYPMEECPIDRALPENFDVRAHEDMFFRKDGSAFLVSCAASPIFKEGRPVATIVEIRDITEQKRAEKALRDSQAHLIALLEQSAAGICETDLEGRIMHVNDRYCQILARSREDLIGQRMHDLIYHDDLAYSAPLFETLAATEKPFEIEKRYLRPDGSQVWTNVAASLIRPTDENSPPTILAIVLDITERKALEAELQRLNATLEKQVRARTRERDQIWELSRDLIAIVGPDGCYKRLNPAWAHELGYPHEQLIGLRFNALVHPDDRDEAHAAYATMRAGAPSMDVEVRVKAHNDSYRTVSWVVLNVGEDLYAVGRDVTEQRRIEEQLRQSQKMEAIGQLTGGIAHDFNNMLAGIMASLEMMRFRMQQQSTEGIERYVDSALKVADRAAALTHRLLAFARRQTLDPKPVNVNQLIISMEDMVRRSLGPDIVLEIVRDQDISTALCDPSQLENAILNLAINSRDAMPEGGRLTIETANVQLDLAAVAAYPDVAPGPYIRICVSDTGAGMTPEVASRVLEPFFTTKPLGHGTGLGLSMAYGFVKQSHGHLRIYSELGRGTTVQLFLPCHIGAAPANELHSAVTKDIEAQGMPTILLVEDESAIRTLASEMLDALGYKVVAAKDGIDGLKKLAALERVDLLITDVGLPNGMNGRQVADAAREQRPGLKVLFITGFAENAAIGNGLLGPGMQVMTKPFAMATFASRVKSMVEE